MKNSTGHFAIFIAFVILITTCNDKKDDQPAAPAFPHVFEVQKIDCESNVELCNRKPGLKFTALAPVVEDNRPNWRLELRVRFEPQPYTLTICCDTIPRLIDSLRMMNEALENLRRDKPERAERTCQLPDGITISIYYSKDLAGTGEYSSMEFGKVVDGSIFFVYTKEQFEKLIADIEERFKTCCLD